MHILKCICFFLCCSLIISLVNNTLLEIFSIDVLVFPVAASQITTNSNTYGNIRYLTVLQVRVRHSMNRLTQFPHEVSLGCASLQARGKNVLPSLFRVTDCLNTWPSPSSHLRKGIVRFLSCFRSVSLTPSACLFCF